MDLNRRHKLTKEETEHVKKITNSGRLYYDYDPLIESARNFAYETCRRYNRHEADIDAGCGLKIIDCNEVSIGNNVTIGENVGIYTSNHAKDPKLRCDHWCSELPIRIGNNVVIESNSVVLPGTIIEDNVWIRPGSVVLGRIEADSICAGDPARRESK